MPWNIPHAELPYIHPHEAAEWVDKAAQILITEFNYKPTRTVAYGRDTHANSSGEDRWHTLINKVLHGQALHDSIRDLAGMLTASGMHSGAATHLLQSLVELSDSPHDQRWESRLRDIPRAIDSAKKFR